MPHTFLAGEMSLWAQRNGPNTEPVFLGCHAIGDVDQPAGDIELVYCPDPSGPNKFKVVASIQGTAGAITFTITTDVTDEIDELERVKCPFTLFAHASKRGRKDVFDNFDRTFIYTNVSITNRGLSGLVARTPEDQGRVEQSYDVSAEDELRLKEPTITRQSISETNAINDITFCNDFTCRTDEDVAQEACQEGFAVADAVAYGTANVLYTSNGGTWAATTDPFGADENPIAVECFAFGRDTVRAIVANGSTSGAPAEIAYSDDNGVTWTTVNVSAGNTTFATRHGLFALNQYDIWAALANGYIYHSDDAGVSWDAQEAGVINSGAWNAIQFVNDDDGWVVGAANEIARSIDGGTTWSAITGPSAEAGIAAISLAVIDQNRAWVGYADGTLWYTNDGGANWSQRSFPGSGAGEVRDIKFFNESLGFLAANSAVPAGTVLWTINGGFSWSRLDANSNSGYNALFVCDEWNLFVAGEANAGTGYIAKVTV